MINKRLLIKICWQNDESSFYDKSASWTCTLVKEKQSFKNTFAPYQF
jgi:hypothetical protein